ncbi:siderophore-interacting protein [Micromonospora sp. NBC_00858]|uniref:siderophore-interacting protein n=1 Tax=Micromonospora sp. NBC_00858 TaxID=2975979 RepID=UPI00386E99CC|nr:siderophore-interacting protein [Micromonospora sp. NBC_00858]
MTVATIPVEAGLIKRPMLAEVVANRPLTPHLRRITLTGMEIDRFGYGGPDQLARIFLTAPGAELHLPDSEQWWPALQAMPAELRPVVRNYTVRRLDAGRRELDIDFVLHGDGGPASAWARRAAPGDPIGVLSDGSDYAPPVDTEWQLLIGDETAMPAITAAVEALPPGTRAIALIEVGSTEHEIEVRTPAGVTLTWLHRGGTPAGGSAVVIRTLRELALPAGTPYAFVAGESAMVTTVRRHLCTERGMAKDRVYFCGYWKVAAH